MRRWQAALPLVVLAGLGALFVGYALRHDPHVEPAALVGQTAPDLKLQPLAGGAPSPLHEAAKGPVLISFFASWCAPCVEDAPALMALKAQGAPIIGVAYKDVAEKSQAFLAEHGDPFTAIYMDPEGRAGVDFGVSGVPETFAVAADGKVLAKRSGPLTPQDADALMRAISR